MDGEARIKETIRQECRREAAMPDDSIPRRRGRPPKPKDAWQSPISLAAALTRLLRERGLSALGLSRAAGLADDAVRNIISARLWPSGGMAERVGYAVAERWR